MANEQDSLESQKQLALFTACVEAWIETRMEKDKTLLTLATAGLGLVTTLLTTVGPADWYQLWLYGFAGLAFICTIAAAILIFHRNSGHLEDVIQRGVTGDDKLLVKLDFLVGLSFGVGVILTAAIALSSGIAKIHVGGAT